MKTKYQTLYDTMRTRIETGFYPRGGKLPGQNALAAECGVSPITTKRVLNDLEEAGYILRIPKSGSYVRGELRMLRAVTIHIGKSIENPSAWLGDYWHGAELSAAELGIPVRISRKLPEEDPRHGLILIGAEESVVRRLKQSGIPHVAAITPAPFADCRAAVDYSAATKALVETMREAGCRNLCFLGNLQHAVHRMAARAFRRTGAGPVHSVNDRNAGRITEKLLDDGNPPDGVIVMGAFLPFYLFPLLVEHPSVKLGVYTESPAVLNLRRYAFLAHYELEELGRITFRLLHDAALKKTLRGELRCPPFEILTPDSRA